MGADFYDLVKKVNTQKYLLPDFQRDFVWTDEEQQKSIVASVLAKMPIGSILLLGSKADQYACKTIGCKINVDNTTISDDVYFLLDGQQRITVLTNVFSNVIHNKAGSVSKLTSASLKRRFFLRLPKWENLYSKKDEADLFGVQKLEFPFDAQAMDENPDFLTGDVKDFIECISFTATDNKPYNPFVELTTALDDFCISYEDGYLIPLFLMVATGTNQATESTRYDDIILAISEKIKKDIINHYNNQNTNEQKEAFINDFFKPNDAAKIKKNIKNMEIILNDSAKAWCISIKNYLTGCLRQLNLNVITVSEKDKKRAIDIYENLNRGGVSLNTFDLVMARVAIVSKERYLERIIKHIETDKTYPIDDVCTTAILGQIKDYISVNKKYNASINTECVKDKNLDKNYIDIFLDVLSLYSYNTSYDADNYNLMQIKKDKILDIDPNTIDTNTEKIIDALDRTMFFLQTRCGIRRIKDVNYSLIAVIFGVIFTNDEWFNNKKVHDILEAWYWSAIFSGEFDKDQNARMERNLKYLINLIKGLDTVDKLNEMKNNILGLKNFSDKEMLLMQQVANDRYPKNVLRHFICQYFLSQVYSDMFDPTLKISVFFKDASTLEAHHIIPLGSVDTYGESTSALRNKPEHLLNSPLNFVLITKEANLRISCKSLNDYILGINNQAKANLFLNSFTDVSNNPNTLLDNRFDMIQGDIKSRVDNLVAGAI